MGPQKVNYITLLYWSKLILITFQEWSRISLSGQSRHKKKRSQNRNLLPTARAITHAWYCTDHRKTTTSWMLYLPFHDVGSQCTGLRSLMRVCQFATKCPAASPISHVHTAMWYKQGILSKTAKWHTNALWIKAKLVSPRDVSVIEEIQQAKGSEYSVK